MVSPGHRELGRWIHAVESLPVDGRLTRLPVAIEAASNGWIRTTRQRDGRTTEAASWSRRLSVPPGSVGVMVTSSGSRVSWWSTRKGWEREWVLTATMSEHDGCVLQVMPPSQTRWSDPHVRPAPPTFAPFYCGDLAAEWTTGRWLPICRDAEGHEMVVLMVLAKDDTHFLRCGHWRLRPRVAAKLPHWLSRVLSGAWVGTSELGD